MKKIFLLIIAALCFVGCENPNASKPEKKPTKTNEIKVTEYFYDFMPTGYYEVKKDKGLIVKKDSKIDYIWGGVELKGETQDFSSFTKKNESDTKLVLEHLEQKDKLQLKTVFTFLKVSETDFKLTVDVSSKQENKDWKKAGSTSYKMEKKEQPKPYLCVVIGEHSKQTKIATINCNLILSDFGVTKDNISCKHEKTGSVPSKNISIDKKIITISGIEEGKFTLKVQTKNGLKTFTLDSADT